MNLVLTEDQRMIREEAMRLLARRSPLARVRQVVEAGDGVDVELWATIAGELGWSAMAIPQEYGGLGLGQTELVLLLEAAGRHLAALPLWSTTCAAAPLVATVGTEAARIALLSRIATGEAATVAWGDIGSVTPLAATGVSARKCSDDYVLDGVCPQVADLITAGIVLVPAKFDGALALFALPHGAGEVRQQTTLDGTRQIGALTLNGVAVPTSARLDECGFDERSASPALAAAALGLAAEQIGAARGAMDLTLDYIATRVQFGRTIASFQAVKHRCARLEVDLAEARALVYGAAAESARAGLEERRMEVAAARALASDVLFRAAEESIQLHGGVGFTWEYDPHLYLKRAQAAASMFGAPHDNLDVVADALLPKQSAA